MGKCKENNQRKNSRKEQRKMKDRFEVNKLFFDIILFINNFNILNFD